VVSLAPIAFGQTKPAEKPKATESEVTTIRSETKTLDSGWDLTTELWSMEDATPVRQGQLDLRFTTRWAPDPPNDDDDDVVFQPSLVWGAAENLELSVSVPIWIGDAGDRGAYKDGNYDTFIGMLWRFREQEGYWPAMALSGGARIPTGEGSAGIDGEGRLVFTNDYDSGLRSHLNLWAITANGDNDGNETRDFQYGGVAGVDGPLGDSGNLRWVLDYVYRISNVNGGGGENLAEVGFEWKVADAHKVGISGQISLDHAANALAEYSVNVTYALSLAQ
jgi:hypothetical protein